MDLELGLVSTGPSHPQDQARFMALEALKTFWVSPFLLRNIVGESSLHSRVSYEVVATFLQGQGQILT